MTGAYCVVPASVRHIRPMSRRLRAAACITLQGFGHDPRRALHRAYVASFYCRTALIEDRPVAMWGVTGTLISDRAFVWLVISDKIAKLPVSIVREARAQLAAIMSDYHEIATTVLPDDEAAIRFALYLGFHDRHDDDEASMSRKDLHRAILADPRNRIPIGDSYVIGLGYHPAGAC